MEKLDYKQMLKHIDKIVNSNFSFDIELKLCGQDKEPFTQKEAKKMARMIMKVYSISHGHRNGCCAAKYTVKGKLVKFNNCDHNWVYTGILTTGKTMEAPRAACTRCNATRIGW